MAKYKFEIAGEVYTTKSAVKDRAREILYSYQDGQTLSEADFRWVRALLDYHPEADEKIGEGIARIWVQQNVNYPTTRGFHFEREDGTKDNFSFPSCVTPSTPLRDFKRAARKAIAPYTHVARDVAFLKDVVTCPVNGTPLTEDGDSCHVHHGGMSFEDIVAEFIRVENIDVESVSLKRPEHGGVVLDDPDLEKKWIAFHNQRADLEVVSKRANLSDLNKRG